ncbi:MAG: pseudouridine synthase [Gammaproteobacteria bacterium]|nr:pseudouridine synthase [Gammaproteobacteria bacterium]
MSQRIQKRLAHLGIASRRQIESWIASGDVLVNGKRCLPGQHVQGDERILVCGTPVDLHARVPTRVLLYHKPVGEIVTRSDTQQRTTVFDRLPALESGRWVAVGRLDLNTSGLLLLTTDGALAHALMHPGSGLEREYRVRVHGTITEEMVSGLRLGVELEDGTARMDVLDVQASTGANTWSRAVLQEGRNRIVRRLWESQGLEVSHLVRVRFGPLRLPDTLRAGTSLELSPAEVGQLYRAIGKSPGHAQGHQP